MKNSSRPFSRAAQLALAAAAVMACASTLAAAPSAAASGTTSGVVKARTGDGPARGRCPYGIATTGGNECMTKADFQVLRSRQAALDKDPAQYRRNALQRCDSLTGDDRQDCVSRVHGRGTSSGSVEGGGVLRETVTVEIGARPPAKPVGSGSGSATK